MYFCCVFFFFCQFFLQQHSGHNDDDTLAACETFIHGACAKWKPKWHRQFHHAAHTLTTWITIFDYKMLSSAVEQFYMLNNNFHKLQSSQVFPFDASCCLHTSNIWTSYIRSGRKYHMWTTMWNNLIRWLCPPPPPHTHKKNLLVIPFAFAVCRSLFTAVLSSNDWHRNGAQLNYDRGQIRI